MVASPTHPYREIEPKQENNTPQQPQQPRLCDFCGESKALLYCRADSAKLCFNCDREVHSTNPLFTKHTRSQLCDSCDSNPASILCSTDNLVLCQNCDWDSHGKSLTSVHDRRSLEGFTGCPSGVELCSILGVEDVGDKSLLSGGDGLLVDGFSDLLVWDTQPIFSIDDLIGSTDSNQSFQGTGIPPLTKNRNTACGKYKEEILSQLRDMVKLENHFINDHEDLESLFGFQTLVPELSLQPGTMGIGFEKHAEPIIFPVYEENENKWEGNSAEVPVQVPFLSAFIGSYTEQNSLVPDESTDVVDAGPDANYDVDNQLSHPVIRETSHILPKVFQHKSITQNRDSSLSRYKEKRKTRRYDHHIRYESRKARAETRSRVRGRFAKVEP